jgi:flagellar biosynthetic protein FliP
VPERAPDAPLPLATLVPSFLLSEIERAFQVGFLIFLPFLIIDLVVAAILMSMGMMMVPPAVVALPFKLVFFVVADGWALISGALVRSYF